VRLKADGSWQDDGRLAIDVAAERWLVRLLPGAPMAVEAVELEVAIAMPGATAWLSNGFQSWSQRGVLALAERRACDVEARRPARRPGCCAAARALRWYSWVAGGDGLVRRLRRALRLRSARAIRDEALVLRRRRRRCPRAP
jgi:hypothetical protein